MSTPARCAAWMMVSPGWNSMSRSSSLKVGMSFRVLGSAGVLAKKGQAPLLQSSAIALTADHVEGTEAGDHVRHHLARDHLLEAGGHQEARRTDAHPVRGAAAIAHQIEAELTVAPLRVGVHLARRELQALHHDLEVLNGALDRGVDLVLRREDHPRVVHVDRALVGHALTALLDDPRALPDLLDAHHEAVQAVAVGAHGHVEVDFAVLQVRVRLADVVGDARRAQARTRPAERDRVLGADVTDPLESIEEDPVAVEELLALVD